MGFWETVKYFKSKEFASPDLPGSGDRMNHLLIRMLDDLRESLGEPIIINSGYRSKVRNDELVAKGGGAVEDSAHLKGLAIDIKCPDSSYRYTLLNKVFETGFLRVGVGKTFIHLDIDPDKPQAVFWLY